MRSHPIILHVEDDMVLSESVRLSFRAFGFDGTILIAKTVADAKAALQELDSRGEHLDLVISDIGLPDGSGLEVVRCIRADPAFEGVPILVLSGDIDRKTIGRAYALGATCFIRKMSDDRMFPNVVKSLFEHWLLDVSLPEARKQGRTERLLRRSVMVRGRHAAIYVSIAERFAKDPQVAARWLERSLSQSNLANLISFLVRQLGSTELPEPLLDACERLQAHAERVLDATESSLDIHRSMTQDEAIRWMIDLVELTMGDALVEVLGRLFPVSSAAMPAIRDAIASDVEQAADFVEAHAGSHDLLVRAAELRVESARIRGAFERGAGSR